MLIDLGAGKKQLSSALEEIGESLGEISAVLITHEHSDHIKGLKAVCSSFSFPVFIPKACLEACGETAGNAVPFGGRLRLNSNTESVTVTSFETSHDSSASVGYVIETPEGKIGICTDTGCLTADAAAHLSGCRGLVLESNYDPVMLADGIYPATLKRRILSDRGHLSNIDCAEAICRLYSPALESVILAHLSEENNTPSLALGTVMNFLEKKGIGIDVKVALKSGAVSLF